MTNQIEILANPETVLATVAHNMVARLGAAKALSLSLKAITTMRDKADTDGLALWLDLHAKVELTHSHRARFAQKNYH